MEEDLHLVVSEEEEEVVGVEEDPSRATELQEDDDLDRPCREGEDGGLLLRVDASLVLELQSLLGLEMLPCFLSFPFSFLSTPHFIPSHFIYVSSST